MPFVQGGDMYQVMLKNRRLPEYNVKFYIIQVILAVGELHRLNYMHRDLKLENLMIEGDGYLKLIDYGLAAVINKKLQFEFCGTPEYIAPEIVNQMGHDRNVDWWSIGILAFEMLFGVTPFFNRDKNVLYRNILSN